MVTTNDIWEVKSFAFFLAVYRYSSPHQNTALVIHEIDHCILILFLNLLLDHSHILSIILETVGWDLVQSQHRLVGVLDQDVFAFLALQTHVGDRANDTPSVGKREIHLLGEVTRLPADNAENDVAVVGLGVSTGNESASKLVKVSEIRAP